MGLTRIFKSVKSASLPLLFSAALLSCVDQVRADPPITDKKAAEIGAKSDQYSEVVDRAIAALVDGDAKTFRAYLSPGTIKREQRGPDAVNTIINERFIPFFKDFQKFSYTVNTIATRDIDGNKGLALARSFYTTGGSEKFFVIYVLDEQGTLTIGNLLLNTTMADITRGR